MSEVLVLTLPVCPACKLTKKTLGKMGVAYREIDLSVDEKWAEWARTNGYMQAPVVVAGDVSWQGFRPDRLKELADERVRGQVEGASEAVGA